MSEENKPEDEQEKLYGSIYQNEMRAIEIFMLGLAALNHESGLPLTRSVEPPIIGAIQAAAQLAITHKKIPDAATFGKMCESLYINAQTRLAGLEGQSQPRARNFDDLSMFDLEGDRGT